MEVIFDIDIEITHTLKIIITSTNIITNYDYKGITLKLAYFEHKNDIYKNYFHTINSIPLTTLDNNNQPINYLQYADTIDTTLENVLSLSKFHCKKDKMFLLNIGEQRNLKEIDIVWDTPYRPEMNLFTNLYHFNIKSKDPLILTHQIQTDWSTIFFLPDGKQCGDIKTIKHINEIIYEYLWDDYTQITIPRDDNITIYSNITYMGNTYFVFYVHHLKKTTILNLYQKVPEIQLFSCEDINYICLNNEISDINNKTIYNANILCNGTFYSFTI